MKRLIVLLFILVGLAVAQTPRHYHFVLILSSKTSGVLLRPAGMCKTLIILVSADKLPPTPALVDGTFDTVGNLSLNGVRVTVDQFTEYTAPGCAAASTPSKSVVAVGRPLKSEPLHFNRQADQ